MAGQRLSVSSLSHYGCVRDGYRRAVTHADDWTFLRTDAVNNGTAPTRRLRCGREWEWPGCGFRIMAMHFNTIVLLFLLATLALFARIWVPWGAGVAGNLVRQESLSVLGRLRMHGPAAIAIWLAAVICLVLGWVGPYTVLTVTALFVLLFALPVSYTLTSQGIGVGWTPFRRWTEFGGVARRPGGVRLQGVAGAPPMIVWLPGGREDDDFVLLLRQLVRGSYKGQLGPEAGMPTSAASGASPGTIGIAGVGGS